MRKSVFSWLTKYLFILEFHFDAMLYCYLGKENSDVGHAKCSRGPQVSQPGLKDA